MLVSPRNCRWACHALSDFSTVPSRETIGKRSTWYSSSYKIIQVPCWCWVAAAADSSSFIRWLWYGILRWSIDRHSMTDRPCSYLFELLLLFVNICWRSTRREFFREILYKNIAIIAIQHSKMYFVDTFGDFSHTVERNSLKSVWQISLYILG